MKKFILVLSVLFLLNSCEKKPSDKPDIEEPEATTKTESKADKKNSENVETISREFKTKTGKSFIVSEEKPSASISNISVVTAGFSEVNDTLYLEESDPIAEITITDLNKDGFGEIFIITESAGSGSYVTIYGFSSNKDKSVTGIIVPEISQSDRSEGAIFNGYQGHDSIYFSKNRLFRKFPVYKEGDENCCPSGGDKTIQYVLKHGEASWRLQVK